MMGKENSQNGNCSSKAKTEKNVGRWSADQHVLFLEGIRIYGKNWKKIQPIVGTRTGSQIRSHAQKFFNKLQRNMKSRKNRGKTRSQLLGFELNEARDSSEEKGEKGCKAKERVDQVVQQPIQEKRVPVLELANGLPQIALIEPNLDPEPAEIPNVLPISDTILIPQPAYNPIQIPVFTTFHSIWTIGMDLLKLNFLRTFVDIEWLHRCARDPLSMNQEWRRSFYFYQVILQDDREAVIAAANMLRELQNRGI